MQMSLSEEMTSTLKVTRVVPQMHTIRGLHNIKKNKNLKYKMKDEENQIIKWQIHKHCVIKIYLHYVCTGDLSQLLYMIQY